MSDTRGLETSPLYPPHPVYSVEHQQAGNAIAHKQFEHYHLGGSVNTSASNSADSSPTTTISTVDDSSATEMSPNSSPESPMAKAYPGAHTFATSQTRPQTSDGAKYLHSATPYFDLQRPITPGKRPKNLKNLAVNTSGSLQYGRAASTTSLPMAAALNGASKADTDGVGRTFNKPPSPPRRRPSNLGLTIMTPANTRSLPQNVQLAIPPTPSITRPNTLRHFQSSPSLPLHIAEIPPATPSMSRPRPLQATAITSPIKSDDSEPNFDVPQSKEEKPEAYPDGPIRVYGPHLDLYLEPTAEQARGYDVIMNVASEVRNPFDTSSKPAEPEPELRIDGGGGIQYAPKRNFPTTQRVGFQRDQLSPVVESSPTTPKASPMRAHFAQSPAPTSAPNANEEKYPEYIHIPWEHNTDIVPDLVRLVRLIDDRVKARKRVLIHCQCGVSRSATLVVAYVIYKNPTMSVQEAYDTVKKRSKWIGPNMNLIMQLQEFRSTITKPAGRFATSRGMSPISPALPLSEWGRPGPHADLEPKMPKTAPLPPETKSPATLLVSPDMAAVTPGPSSAPSGLAWPFNDRQESLAEGTPAPPVETEKTAYVDPSGHVLPVLNIPHEEAESKTSKLNKGRPRSLNLDNHSRSDSGKHFQEPLVSPRAEEFAMISLQPPKEVESEDRFGLMSPTSTEFSQAPLDRDALLGALGMSSTTESTTSRMPRLATQPDTTVQHESIKNLSLRPKVSAPSLREQQELQQMQAELHATLAQQAAAASQGASGPEALMSPRALEFTENPFAPVHERPEAKLVLPDEEDPRSPAQKGASPITRNILDVL